MTEMKVINNKTGNHLYGNVELWKSAKTGEMKYSGMCLETGKTAVWKASNCSEIK